MKKQDRYPFICLVIFIAVFIICAIKPVYPRDHLLESLLSIIFVPMLVFTYRRFRFSNTSYTLMLVFMIMHTIGSHYTYSNVVFMDPITNFFNFSRNHYDRIVHFMFGALMYYPFFELFKNNFAKKDKFVKYLFPFFFIVALGAIYEIIEWLVTIIVEPELGLAYLGVQGDIWDAQKDMALKFIGALITMTIIILKNILKNKN